MVRRQRAAERILVVEIAVVVIFTIILYLYIFLCIYIYISRHRFLPYPLSPCKLAIILVLSLHPQMYTEIFISIYIYLEVDTSGRYGSYSNSSPYVLFPDKRVLPYLLAAKVCVNNLPASYYEEAITLSQAALTKLSLPQPASATPAASTASHHNANASTAAAGATSPSSITPLNLQKDRSNSTNTNPAPLVGIAKLRQDSLRDHLAAKAYECLGSAYSLLALTENSTKQKKEVSSTSPSLLSR